MSTEQTDVPAPADGSTEPAPAPRRWGRLLPLLVMVCALGLAALLVGRVGPRPVPPPVVPAYTPQQSGEAEVHLDALRDELTRPTPPPEALPAPSAGTSSPAQPQPAPPAPLRARRLELSQQDLNAYLATNPNAKVFLARQGVKAIQILFQPPHNVIIRAAVLYRKRPANVQITGELRPSRRTMIRFVATGAQVGRLPLPPETVTAQADKLAALFTRRLRGRVPLSVQSVQVIGDRIVLTGKDTPTGEDARHRAGLSTTSVTGPSLATSTSMSAPNSPVWTAMPRARTAAMKRSMRGMATGGGAASVNDGRRPLRASPSRVNCETISIVPPSTSDSARFIFPASSSKPRRPTSFPASHSASAGVSPSPTPSRTISPGPTSRRSPVSLSVTLARNARWITARMGASVHHQEGSFLPPERAAQGHSVFGAGG